MKVGDKVRIKANPKGDVRAFYRWVAEPDMEYVIEHIDKLGDVYVAGINNYFHQNSLELVG